MRHSNHSLLAAALFAAMGWAGSAAAADYYVDQMNPAAADSNTGTAERPWLTMYRAAQAQLKPGDTVYVKPGRYDVSKGGNWDLPAINPATSGTKEAPITFRAQPTHGAILDAAGNNPGFGSRDRHYIVIDGFVMDNCGTKGIAVFGASEASKVRGVVLKNNIVRRVHNAINDNTDGIRIEDAADVVVQNNRIYDIRNPSMDANAAGIKLYRVENGVFENNEIYAAATGIIDKQGGLNNIFRRNYIHDCARIGIYMKTGYPHATRGLRAYQNIIDKTYKSVLVEENNSSTVITDIHVYNNVFANYREAGMSGPRYGANRMMAWNNIFLRATTPEAGEFYSYNDPPATVSRMDYNLYSGSGLKFLLGRYATNRSFTTLSSWSAATGFDTHALAGDPGFVNAAAGDFHLSATSPALGAGRSDGTATGQPTNMGAYITGTEVIGLLSVKEPPKAPRLLSAE